MKKRVVHVKFTNCSFAPDDYVKCINKYSENYEATLLYKEDSRGPYVENNPIHTPTDEEMYKVLKEGNFDFVHFHNNYIDIDIPQVIHFHSPPNFNSDAIENYTKRKLVVGSIWAILPEYADCTPVPTILDIYEPLYSEQKSTHPMMIIGYSPSITHTWPCGETDKGYVETHTLLKKVFIKNKDKNVRRHVMTDMSLTECMKHKAECDILIDECVNRGYHKCSLEAMSLGKLTICSLDEEVHDVARKMMGIDNMPLHRIWMKDLEKGLQDIIDKGREYIQAEGVKTRKWMEENWNPKKVISIFEQIYEEELK